MDIEDEEFGAYFKRFGVVSDSVVIKDKATGRPRGFGFVTFRDATSVHKALRNKRTNALKGKWVDVKSIFDYE